jgi:paraquat-inducible protein B
MPEDTDLPRIPLATVAPKRRPPMPVVWIVPLLAAVVALGVAAQRLLSEGPIVTIIFKTASGIEAGKTFVKYKDVNIGEVTAVRLTSDYSRVEVTAQIARSAAALMVEDAKFWIVEPRVTLSGISGLDTLLSGNFIGFEAGRSSEARRTFIGLDAPPIITGDQPGRQFVLKAETLGSLGIGSPVYYRRLQAGRVVGCGLARSGTAVEITIFVNAPYDRYVHRDSPFWNVSGLDVSVGAEGVEVRTESLVALFAGGIAFDTPSLTAKAEPAPANAEFTLYHDQVAAMKELESIASRYVLYFDESLRGLSVGAPVTLLGRPAGEVTAIGLDLDEATLDIRGRVEIVSFPDRLLAKRRGGDLRGVLQRLVEQRGLRAQLRTANLLTGQLYIAFDYFPDAHTAQIDWTQKEPVLPVVPNPLADVESKLTRIVAKLDRLPLEAIGDDLGKALIALAQTLGNANALVTQVDEGVIPGVTATIEELRHTIAGVNGILKNTDATLLGKDAPAQRQLRDALQEVARAARSLRVLADYLERHPEALIRGKPSETP